METKTKQNGTTTIVKAAQAPLAAPPANPYAPRSFDEAIAIAKRLSAIGLVPDAFRGKENDILLVMMTGNDLGLSVTEAFRAFFVFKGKLGIFTSYIIARVQAHPECEYFQLVESTPKVATWEGKRKGHPKPTRISWTIEQAARAGLTGKDTWKQYPEAMLRWRSAKALADVLFPDATFGLPSAEELADEDTILPRDVTPPPVPVEPKAPDLGQITSAQAARAAATATVEEPTDAEFTVPEPPPQEGPPPPFDEPAADPTEADISTCVKMIEAVTTKEQLNEAAAIIKDKPDAVRKSPPVKSAWLAKQAALRKS